MFKNPLKYANGGSTQNAIQELVAWLMKNTGQDKNTISERLNQILNNDKAKNELTSTLKEIQNGDKRAESKLISMFTPQSAKFGGKIHDFICKHAKGGQVAGCGCGGNVEKAALGSDGIVGWLNGLRDRFIGRRMPDVPGVNNRRVRTWTDANGIQHIVEDANVNGYSTRSSFNILQPGDTSGVEQRITTGDGRKRVVNWPQGTPEQRSVIRRTVQEQENGGKVEKAQDGSLIDYYSNKWSNDLNRIKSGWQRFKESAPGKVMGAFMPNPNSESGMLGAVVPIGKITPAMEARAASRAAGWEAVNGAIEELLPGWLTAGAVAIAKDELSKKDKNN